MRGPRQPRRARGCGLDSLPLPTGSWRLQEVVACGLLLRCPLDTPTCPLDKDKHLQTARSTDTRARPITGPVLFHFTDGETEACRG